MVLHGNLQRMKQEHGRKGGGKQERRGEETLENGGWELRKNVQENSMLGHGRKGARNREIMGRNLGEKKPGTGKEGDRNLKRMGWEPGRKQGEGEQQILCGGGKQEKCFNILQY